MSAFKRLFAAAFLFVSTAHAQVAQIDYTATALGGTQWRYDYVVQNTGPTPLDELTIYFSVDSFSGLTLISSPAGWDSVVAQPDLGLPAAGFIDMLASAGLGIGETVSGFSVSFNFLGGGTPGSQPFDIVDPATFQPLASGFTTTISAPVPEPSSVFLMLVGIGCLIFFGRRFTPPLVG